MMKLISIGLTTVVLSVGGLMWYSASLESQRQVQAGRLSLAIIEAQGAVYDRLAERAHQMRLDAYERKFGLAARFRLEDAEQALGLPRDFRDPR
jgi:hypothetical protein